MPLWWFKNGSVRGLVMSRLELFLHENIPFKPGAANQRYYNYDKSPESSVILEKKIIADFMF